MPGPAQRRQSHVIAISAAVEVLEDLRTRCDASPVGDLDRDSGDWDWGLGIEGWPLAFTAAAPAAGYPA